MRLPLATDLKTRTGAPDKDARIKNAYVETKGDQAVVRKRPIARGGVVTGSGVAQGGIAVLVDGVQKVVTFWGDTPVTSTDGSGTTWSSGTSYSTGDHTTSGWQDYWAVDDNVGNNPTNSPAHWSTTYVSATAPTSGWTLGTIPIGPYSGNHTVAYNGSIFCYLQDNPITGFATPFTSTNGLIWTQHPDITGFSYGITGRYGINWNGVQFLAVGQTGVASMTATSSDGITWTTHQNVTSDEFADVAWNGTVYCAVVIGSAFTSSDGIIWTAHAFPAGINYLSITWNGSVFCAISYNSSIACTSPDGIAWTQRTLPYSTTWRYITSRGSLIVATGGNGTRIAISADNGATWNGIIQTTPIQNIAASASLIVGVNPGATTSTYCTSSDGITWTNHALPAIKVWSTIAYGAGKGFVAMDNTTICAFSSTGL